MAEKKRTPRKITSNVQSFEELVSVKRSIYPWDDLKEAGSNFFVEFDDLDKAKTAKASIKNSGLNYFLKRKINLVPMLKVCKLESGAVGVLCIAVPTFDE